MPIKRVIYITIGCVGLGLGAVGATIPLLPSFPFLMVAAVCFGKSSERLNNWFTGTNLYKDNLESFVHGRGMTLKAKIRMILVITATMALGFIMMGKVPVGRIILSIIWVFHILYFIFIIPTINDEEKEEKIISSEVVELFLFKIESIDF